LGFPSRRRPDAGELAMDLARHHAYEPSPNGDRSASRALLVKWNSLHAVRTGLGAAATLIIPVGARVDWLRLKGVTIFYAAKSRSLSHSGNLASRRSDLAAFRNSSPNSFIFLAAARSMHARAIAKQRFAFSRKYRWSSMGASLIVAIPTWVKETMVRRFLTINLKMHIGIRPRRFSNSKPVGSKPASTNAKGRRDWPTALSR
jgi:hypothetical protein